MGLLERWDRRNKRVLDRANERARAAADGQRAAEPASRGSGSGYDLSGLEVIAQVFPPAAVLLVIALPILLVASVLRRRR